MNKLYFSSTQITTQDVIDEISLAISLSGCPLHCKGCHSSFTWDPLFGEELTDEKLEKLILKNKYISCVLFYGGEWELSRLIELIKVIKKLSHKVGSLKICLYTGLTLEEIKQTKPELLNILDYIKVGRFVKTKGPLNKKTTNQKFYKIIHNNINNTNNDFKLIDLIDLTEKFFIN